MGSINYGAALCQDLCRALGIDPNNRPIHSIKIEAETDEPAWAVVTFIDMEASGKLVDVVKRYKLVEID